MSFQNKVVLVTGGALGIGQAIAERFSNQHATVIICDYLEHEMNETVNSLQHKGFDVTGFLCDVRRKKDIDRIVDDIYTKWGRIDVLVNNAGICKETSFLEISENEWDQHFDVNVKGLFLMSQRVARKMIEHKTSGAIINLSSVNGIHAEAMQAHYNATKGAVNLLTMSMAIELAPYGIRVNALCPGFIKTGLTQAIIDNPSEISQYVKTIPMGRVGAPDEVAKVAVSLASEDFSYVTGHCLVVDGGQLIKLA